MSRLILRLPDTLHQQLIHLAESEGVSLNPISETSQQQSDFTKAVLKITIYRTSIEMLLRLDQDGKNLSTTSFDFTTGLY